MISEQYEDAAQKLDDLAHQFEMHLGPAVTVSEERLAIEADVQRLRAQAAMYKALGALHRQKMQ